MIVVNNYDLGTDVIPEEEQIVPDPLVTDVGKVLTVNNAGNPAWEDAPEELPALTGNAGKVLTVSSGSSGVEWAEVPEELPAVTSADEGDVLTVNASGEWEAAAPGGGGGGLAVIHSTLDDALDKTWKEIHDALIAGSSVTIKNDSTDESLAVGIVIDAVYDSYSVRPYYIEAYGWSGSGFSIEKYHSTTENGTLTRVGD